jgi:hypothetical protein
MSEEALQFCLFGYEVIPSFFYVIEVVGSMHLMLEKGFHKGDNIKHFLGTVVVFDW